MTFGQCQDLHLLTADTGVLSHTGLVVDRLLHYVAQCCHLQASHGKCWFWWKLSHCTDKEHFKAACYFKSGIASWYSRQSAVRCNWLSFIFPLRFVVRLGIFSPRLTEPLKLGPLRMGLCSLPLIILFYWFVWLHLPVAQLSLSDTFAWAQQWELHAYIVKYNMIGRLCVFSPEAVYRLAAVFLLHCHMRSSFSIPKTPGLVRGCLLCRGVTALPGLGAGAPDFLPVHWLCFMAALSKVWKNKWMSRFLQLVPVSFWQDSASPLLWRRCFQFCLFALFQFHTV